MLTEEATQNIIQMPVSENLLRNVNLHILVHVKFTIIEDDKVWLNFSSSVQLVYELHCS